MDFDKILKVAINKKASDVHLVHGLPPILRIDGDLFSLDKNLSGEVSPFANGISEKKEIKPLSHEAGDDSVGKYVLSLENGEIEPVSQEDSFKDYSDTITSSKIHNIIKKIVTKERLSKFYEKKDLDLSYQVEEHRFRLNLSRERGNFKIVARVINEVRPTMENVAMPEVVKNLLNKNSGLILVTGPAGCGKSTSLAAMINYINDTRGCNIVTLEDPIEYVFKSNKSIITQRQLGTDIPTFVSGLKHVLRQDPNVIMVGEMRDLETISAALTLAETGHLVLATLHTRSAHQTVDRIIDIFPPHNQNQIKSQLSNSLSAVISQVLVPKIGGGRVAAREILINTPAVGNLIREHKISQIKNVVFTNSEKGMISLERSLANLYEKGVISADVFKSLTEE
jgi:twitching motility protein PilT